MNEQIASSNILGVAGNTRNVFQSSPKNSSDESPLGEKFHFSSILGATIDSPEKTYANAQKPKDPADNVQSSKPSSSEQDTFGKKYDDEISLAESNKSDYNAASNDDASNGNAVEQSRPEQQSAASEKGAEASAHSNQNQSDIEPEQNPNDLFGDTPPADNVDQSQLAAAVAPPVVTQKTQTTPQSENKVPRAVAAEKIAENVVRTKGSAPDSNGQITSKAAGEVLASALRDTKISKVGEDLHKAVFKNTAQAVIEHKAPSIGNALANKQERDLSQRLKNSAFAPVKVTVESNGNKIAAKPSHTKAPVAQLVELSLQEGQDSSVKATVDKLATAASAKGANGHSISTEAKAQTSQEASTNVNQMLRQQAAAMGAQQSAANQAAAGPKSAITADIPNVNSVAAPNVPERAQQVTKATPPPPPPKPPVPIEQIAVQIKKAIGQGVDKITIKLNPANLGKVEVAMEIARDGQLTATVIAEKPETLELLQRDVRGLEKALQEGGLKTDSQSFNFSLKEQAQQQAATGRDQNNGQQSQKAPKAADDENAHSIASQASVYGQNVATNGGIDIRI